MKAFLNDDFLLSTETARRLYHDYARVMPLIDYHCHLPPDQIAGDINFASLTQVWLGGDHYKWRAMRANGVDESYITGNRPDREKFRKWAATVPYTLRNPLYHWTHLELQRYFGINDILCAENADAIYDRCTESLQTREYTVRQLISKMNVQVICTTDDPVDTLEHHKRIAADGFATRVLPAFRPDKAMDISDPISFNAYLSKLERAASIDIGNFNEFVDALKKRHDYFAEHGCSVSDHGLEKIDAEDFTIDNVKQSFNKIRAGKELTVAEINEFRSAMLYQFAIWDHEKNWVQQYHLGALRNNNSRLFRHAGADTGTDSIGDFSQAQALSRFLNRLDESNQLTKTILYNLNPADNEIFATMAGNFNDGSSVAKIQYGSAWWFLDQKDGMVKQINALSNMGLLSRFVGMLTDSRSFLSYPRHEYFRRILCNLFGEEIENGELPGDIDWTGSVIQDICYRNARDYFNWKTARS